MTYTDGELLADLRGFAGEHERPPTATEVNDPANDDFPNATAFIYHFGTWNGAVEAAGLPTFARSESGGSG